MVLEFENRSCVFIKLVSQLKYGKKLASKSLPVTPKDSKLEQGLPTFLLDAQIERAYIANTVRIIGEETHEMT